MLKRSNQREQKSAARAQYKPAMNTAIASTAGATISCVAFSSNQPNPVCASNTMRKMATVGTRSIHGENRRSTCQPICQWYDNVEANRSFKCGCVRVLILAFRMFEFVDSQCASDKH